MTDFQQQVSGTISTMSRDGQSAMVSFLATFAGLSDVDQGRAVKVMAAMVGRVLTPPTARRFPGQSNERFYYVDSWRI